jgi:phage antirepressor YoqD-like protein
MNTRITRREVAKQLSIANQLLLEWIDHRGNSREKIKNNDIEEYLHEPRLLAATEVAKILKISMLKMRIILSHWVSVSSVSRTCLRQILSMQ